MKQLLTTIVGGALAMVVLALPFGGTADAQTAVRYVTIGTGGVTGVYYPAGGAVCRLVNKGRRSHGIRCSVESTKGSSFNVDAMRTGDLDFGVVQSDVQYAAVHGQAPFEIMGPYPDLRSVFNLYTESFTVLARADADIKVFDDLKGKRVNIGNPGSGQRATLEMLMNVKGWSASDFSETMELTSAEQSRALCNDKIDAMVFIVGHPNASIKEASITCATRLVEVTGPDIEKLIADKPFFRLSTIPGGMYLGSERDARTFGVGATLVTTANTPESVVYELVKAVFENIDDFRMLHPAFGRLEPAKMINHGLSAPLHPGAERYYREVGLLK
ncbi:TAXI family TRAP transporter solute-binding subunit [Magnetovibrio sp.]|uniref:TAXI family TRAP transporter solute-binding subunit n=1 Tax=Magnetovibrio sp. TaxID=2024836 RepID=UPI002F91DE33